MTKKITGNNRKLAENNWKIKKNRKNKTNWGIIKKKLALTAQFSQNANVSMLKCCQFLSGTVLIYEKIWWI